MYGPLDMVTLTGEKVKSSNMTDYRRYTCVCVCVGVCVCVFKSSHESLPADPLRSSQVDILLMTQPQSGRWVHFDTEVTNSSGRVAYTIPKSKKLGLGVYPIKMVVK